MRLTRCRLLYCRCIRYGASVKLLEPCTLMRHSGKTVVKLFFVRHLVGSGFSPPVCITVAKSTISEDRTHDYETYALPTALLSLSPLWCIGEVIGALYVDAAFLNNTVATLSFVPFLFFSDFLSPVCTTVAKSAISEDRNHDFKIM